MCGRYIQRKGGQYLLDFFGIPRDRADDAFAEWEPRYNIAPTTFVPAVYQTDEGRRGAGMRWGLLPFWATPKDAFKTINARSEEIHEKASFKKPIRERRCLIPASGWVEWKGEKGNKQPYYFTAPGHDVFAFAGVWERWKAKDSTDEPIFTCSILTTAPNEYCREYHDRMPVVIQPEHYDYWLDPKVTEVADIRDLFTAVPNDYISAVAVNKDIGNVKNQGAHLIEPMASLF